MNAQVIPQNKNIHRKPSRHLKAAIASFIERIREIGRAEWKKEIGYHRRSLVETAMFRLKTLLGAQLSTRKFANQKVEAAIWCNIINQMTSLGMPHSIRVN